MNLQRKLVTVEKRVFSLGRFTKDPQVINFYTGFKDYQTLKWLYVALQPTAATMTRYKDTNANLRHSTNTENIKFNAIPNESLPLMD